MMQEFISHMYFGLIGNFFIKSCNIYKVRLGPEISTAKVLDHDDQFNDFHQDDASKP
jgi:hypothetical protein